MAQHAHVHTGTANKQQEAKDNLKVSVTLEP